jgi:hypothetical protein
VGGGADGPAPAAGHLCASFGWDARVGGWRVVQISEGEAWDETASASLAAAGGQVGDLLLAIDGTRLRRETPPEALLGAAAEREVMLTIRRDGGRGAKRGAGWGGGGATDWSAGAAGGGAGRIGGRISTRSGSSRGKARQPTITNHDQFRHRAAGENRLGDTRAAAGVSGGAAGGQQRDSHAREWSVRARPACLARARRAAYLDWVACNRQRVHGISGGAVGCARRIFVFICLSGSMFAYESTSLPCRRPARCTFCFTLSSRAIVRFPARASRAALVCGQAVGPDGSLGLKEGKRGT